MINKIEIKKGVKIINNNYVIKKKISNIDSTFNYLLSRSFDYFPRIIKENDDEIFYEYIDEVNVPLEQKITDLMNVLSLLHSKTTFYKEIDLDYYKYLYEDILGEIDDIYNYYNNLINIINGTVYMSPSDYLIARNISIINNALEYAKENIIYWYDLIKGKRKMRVSLIHNNLEIDHFLKNDRSYLVSWDKSKIDMPIYDLVNLYKRHYLNFDFISTFKTYFSKYPFLEEEMILFLSILSIPSKIVYDDSEYKMVLNIRRVLDYVYKTSLLVQEFDRKLPKESVEE